MYDERYGLIDSSKGNLPGHYGPLPAGGSVRNNGVTCPGDDTPTTRAIPIRGTPKNIRWVSAIPIARNHENGI